MSSFPLDGRLERAALHPLLAAVLGLLLAFILFQAISTVVAFGLIIVWRSVPLADLVADMPAVLEEYAGDLIVANTAGQVLGLLVPALLLARLHSSGWPRLLRIRPASIAFTVIAVVGLLALIPVVQALGAWADSWPWPESIRNFEQGQMDLIERILLQDFPLVFSISMLALTPAICEEFLFRGYVQRQAERALGAVQGVLFSGIVFGLYHLRLTQALALSVLGIYLAWITWRSGSILPAIVVHLVNNSLAAILGKLSATGQIEMDVETFQVPWSIVVGGLVVFAVIAVVLNRVAGTSSAEHISDDIPAASGDIHERATKT